MVNNSDRDSGGFASRRIMALEEIDRLIRSDPGGRGLASVAGRNPLALAGESLSAARSVLVATGFCVRDFMIGETDGPPGAVLLARVLSDLGVGVGILTDKYSASLVAAALDVYRLVLPIFTAPDDPKDTAAYLDALARDFVPSHVIAIERPGSAADGSRYSMRAEKLDDIAPAFDCLFGEGRRWTTMAVGDGGNELGMGSLPRSLRAAVRRGDLIFAAAGADFPIVAGVSNWGAWALAASAGLFSAQGTAETLPDHDRELEVLRRIVAAGAVDGAAKSRTTSVDGLPLESYLDVPREIVLKYREVFA